jgi:hypothetical protein
MTKGTERINSSELHVINCFIRLVCRGGIAEVSHDRLHEATVEFISLLEFADPRRFSGPVRAVDSWRFEQKS